MLSKSLRPIPIVKKDADGNIHDAFSDPEMRYRQRYVDLIVNDFVKETFIKRTKITNTIRQFFNERDYLEVETPIFTINSWRCRSKSICYTSQCFKYAFVFKNCQ